MGNQPHSFPESKMPSIRNKIITLSYLLVWLFSAPAVTRGESDAQDLITLTTPRLSQTITRIKRKSKTELMFNSGNWHGKNWKHTLLVLSPKKPQQTPSRPQLPMILFLDNFQTGSYPSNADISKFQEISDITNTSVACLGGVPNEPLFERKEGDLMSYSIQRYLETGDRSWPLLIPMVRAVRTALMILSNPRIASQESFIIVGSSKRGWATYLTAATDARVRAFSVLAFDFVRFEEQIIAYHRGESPSRELSMYNQLGLFSTTPAPRLSELFKLLDPFRYKEKLDMPKLLMTGTSDRWWDNSMWKRFAPFFNGQTDVVRLPGAGHSVFDTPLGYQILRAWLISVMREQTP